MNEHTLAVGALLERRESQDLDNVLRPHAHVASGAGAIAEKGHRNATFLPSESLVALKNAFVELADDFVSTDAAPFRVHLELTLGLPKFRHLLLNLPLFVPKNLGALVNDLLSRLDFLHQRR